MSVQNSDRPSTTDIRGADYDFDAEPERSKLSTVKWEMEIERRGDPDIMSFGTADMDFSSPPQILAALRDVIDAGHLGYPHKSASYYKAVIDYYDRKFGWKIDRSWIAANVGIYASMEPIIEQLTEPQDEIMYFSPVHRVFEEVIEATERRPVPIPLQLDNGEYKLPLEAFRRAIGSKTKMLLLCNPHNPVGRAWRRDELKALSEIALENSVIVVSDEVYCGLLFPGVSFTPYGSVSGEASRQSITLYSPSKSFNLTGLKHSIVISENEEFRAAYTRGLKRNNVHYGGSIFGHIATEVALRDCDAWSEQLMRYIASNFEYLKGTLEKHLPRVSVVRPEATYLAWLDFTKLGLSENELLDLFEKDAKLVVTFGAPMGPGGEKHVRFNLGTQRSVLARGIDRLVQAANARSLN